MELFFAALSIRRRHSSSSVRPRCGHRRRGLTVAIGTGFEWTRRFQAEASTAAGRNVPNGESAQEKKENFVCILKS